jgi:hypothetical protein
LPDLVDAGLLQGNNDLARVLFQFGQCPLGSPELAAQEKKNRRFLDDRAPGIVMKNAARAGCVTVKIDGWMFSIARSESLVKALFRVPAAWIKNGQPKIVRIARRHDLSRVPKLSDRHAMTKVK